MWDWSDIACGYFGRKFKLAYLLIYLVSTRSRVHLEKLTGSQLIKEFPNFIQPEISSPHSQVPATCRSSPLIINKISHMLWSSKWSLSLRSPHPNPMYTCTLPIRALCRAQHIVLDFITRKVLGEGYRSLSSSLCSFLQFLFTSSLLDPHIPLNTLFSNNFILVSTRKRPSFTPKQNNRQNFNELLKLFTIFTQNSVSEDRSM